MKIFKKHRRCREWEPVRFPMGASTYAVACAVCVHREKEGTPEYQGCMECQLERVSHWELDLKQFGKLMQEEKDERMGEGVSVGCCDRCGICDADLPSMLPSDK